MPRYAAFLRGVSPTNAKMPDVKRAFETAGFTNVATIISSGNVVFDADSRSTPVVEKKAEAAMRTILGRSFTVIARPVELIERLLASDPYRTANVPAEAKRVVTFVRTAPATAPKLPMAQDGATIVAYKDGMAFTAYVPSAKGPVFMTLIDKAFGKDQTTRTWQTLEKVVGR